MQKTANYEIKRNKEKWTQRINCVIFKHEAAKRLVKSSRLGVVQWLRRDYAASYGDTPVLIVVYE
jgi:hypothetical protein